MSRMHAKIIVSACFAAGAIGLAALAWRFWRMGAVPEQLLAGLLALGALRLLYEITLNRNHIPTIASAPAVRRQMAMLLREDWQTRGLNAYRIVDLGAGRGELARAIARAVPAAQVIAVEHALLPHLWLRLCKTVLGPKNLQAVRDDLFAFDCHTLQAVVLFVGRLAEPVGVKLWAELQPGSLVISNDFALRGDWPEPDVITLYTPFKTRLFVYRRP